MMELLSPAGGIEQLRAAVRFGADAVYGGLRKFGLRAAAGNFDWDELKDALDIVHGAKKKFYLTLNALLYDDELNEAAESAARAAAMGVDAAIVSDLGAIALLREKVPQLEIHVSTQANVMNAPTVRLLAGLGCKRVVLARELSLERIRKLREEIPEEVEIEAFVHGAMCMAYSGRCMFSDHLANRGGNRGACAQPCRWQYTVVEAKRAGEKISVLEDERGTSLFSAYDLNMLSHLPEMHRAGIASLKIEGRMKTAYYVASVTQVYRKALNLLCDGEEAYRRALPALQAELRKVSHRDSNTGFYFGKPQPASGAEGFSQTMEFVGRVLERREERMLIEVKNRFHTGDRLEVLSPDNTHAFTVECICREEDGGTLPFVSVAGQRVWINASDCAAPGDYLRGPNRNHRMDNGDCEACV